MPPLGGWASRSEATVIVNERRSAVLLMHCAKTVRKIAPFADLPGRIPRTLCSFVAEVPSWAPYEARFQCEAASGLCRATRDGGVVRRGATVCGGVHGPRRRRKDGGKRPDYLDYSSIDRGLALAEKA